MEKNELIGIYVKKVNFHEPDFFLCEPLIEAYVVDKSSGSSIKGNSSKSNIFSYKSPFTLTHLELEKRSLAVNWSRLLVIDHNFSDLSSNSKILLFEIIKRVRSRKTDELENQRIAWAFLVPMATDGSMNTNLDLKLQLYKVQKNCKVSHQDCNIFHLYADHKRKKFSGFLQITVKGVLPNPTKPSEKEEEEPVEDSKKEEKQVVDLPLALKSPPNTWEWTRLPTQSCKVPNKIHRVFNLGKNGVSCLQFSRSGVYVASAVQSKILIHEVLSGAEVTALNSHVGFIYEIDWSFDDQYILSVSNDCRGAVWNIFQKSLAFVLPHPCYVYCGKWFGNNEQIVTGSRDHMLRFWCKNGEAFDLVEEIPGHFGFVSALATQNDSFVFSGDSHGCVIIRKHSGRSFTLVKELSLSNISKCVIDSIYLHSNRRILISARTRGSFLVDIFSGVVLQTYKSSVSAIARVISSLSPCGSLFFSFCQNGDVNVWEVNTGRVIATYDNLFPSGRLSDSSGFIRYHPYEHMLAVTALAKNFPLMLLKYETSKTNDSEILGLSFKEKKTKEYSRY